MGRDFTFNSTASVDLGNGHGQLVREELESVTSCVLPSREDDVFIGCDIDIQGPVTSESQSEGGLTKEDEEGDQEKEMTFPGAYPIEQQDVYVALDERGELPAKDTYLLVDSVQVVQNKGVEANPVPCPTVERPILYGLEKSFSRFVAYLFDW